MKIITGSIHMNYFHQWTNEKRAGLPTGKVICVGRNYADHAQELQNPVPKEPLLFMKPQTAIVSLYEPIAIPQSKGEVHYEAEIAVLVGRELKNADKDQATKGIAGIGVALDLTLRDLQSQLKQEGHPWEKAKAFDGSCPLSRFEPIASFHSLNNLEIEFILSDIVKQKGSSAQMLFDIASLMEYISGCFTLQPGDVVLTGTPKGVGPLTPGNTVQIRLNDIIAVRTTVTVEA